MHWSFVTTISGVTDCRLVHLEIINDQLCSYTIIGIPMTPLNIQSVVDEYLDYYSTVLFTWNAPEDNSRVDYYQYYVVYGTTITASNTSNTSAIISGVPYNENITFSLLAGNCVGESATVFEIIEIGRHLANIHACMYTYNIMYGDSPTIIVLAIDR